MRRPDALTRQRAPTQVARSRQHAARAQCVHGRVVLLGLLLACALLVPGCTRELLDHDAFAQADLSGSVRIPLSTTSADGTTYVLRSATVEISGSAMLTLASGAGATGKDDALTAPLPAGSYSLFLRPGFQLREVDPQGVEHTVDARLAAPNPRRFQLREVEDATLKLTFERDGQSIVFGAPAPLRVTSAR